MTGWNTPLMFPRLVSTTLAHQWTREGRRASITDFSWRGRGPRAPHQRVDFLPRMERVVVAASRRQE